MSAHDEEPLGGYVWPEIGEDPRVTIAALRAELQQEREAHAVCSRGQQLILDQLNRATAELQQAREALGTECIEGAGQRMLAERITQVLHNWSYRAHEAEARAESTPERDKIARECCGDDLQAAADRLERCAKRLLQYGAQVVERRQSVEDAKAWAKNELEAAYHSAISDLGLT